MNLNNKSEAELIKIAEAVKQLTEKKKYNFADFLYPDTGPLRRELYPKHMAFLEAGSYAGERAFIAANRVGKTLTGLYEVVMHCTGNYPHWWKGKKFNKPVVCWVCGDRGEIIRDSIQRDLTGGFEYGTGLIPRDAIAKEPLALPGIAGGYGQYFIKHKSGGVSTIIIKTYQSGKEAFEAAKIDVVMLDEECPLDIYIECQMRTLTTNGIVFLTFTPDSGLTDTVLHFLDKPKAGEKEKFVVMVGWDDVPHITKQQREDMIAKIPPHMIDTKTKGIPYRGRGAIYPIPEDEIIFAPAKDFPPKHWPRAYGFDVGWNKTAALWGAYDHSDDTWYIYSEHYSGQQEPAVHASAVRSRGAWIPGVCDPAARSGGKGKDGVAFLEAYAKEGLNLTLANNAVEPGLLEVYNRLSTGRLKICSTLQNFFYEYRMYRRDDNGKPVKKNDHLMDALRYLIMSGFDVLDTHPDEDDDTSPFSFDSDRNSITGY